MRGSDLNGKSSQLRNLTVLGWNRKWYSGNIIIAVVCLRLRSTMISHSFSGLLIAAFAAGIAPGRADEKGPGITHYFDEETYRHLMIDRSEDPTVMVEIRFAADPGYSHRWQGKGTSENREI